MAAVIIVVGILKARVSFGLRVIKRTRRVRNKEEKISRGILITLFAKDISGDIPENV